MTLLALLVSSDDSASEILGRILPASGIAVERFSDLATAIDRLHQQRFNALILDFEDPKPAAEVLEQARRLNSGNASVTVALVAERASVRDVLSDGAHFVLYKPLSEEKARAGLRAVAALLNRERRRAYRVPVQAPVELTLPDSRNAEGILLDLSETGMDVLTAEPQATGALLNFRFQLPDGSLEVHAHGQVAWAKPNGQTGVRFLDLDVSVKAQLQAWLQAAAGALGAGAEETVPHCKLTDLSLGGCYIETASPFPERTRLVLTLRVDGVELQAQGLVRVMHPSRGMGIEFAGHSSERAENFIQFLSSRPGVEPALLVSANTLEAAAPDTHGACREDVEDPLLDLLRNHESFSEEMFLEALRSQRNAEFVQR